MEVPENEVPASFSFSILDWSLNFMVYTKRVPEIEGGRISGVLSFP